VFQKMELPNFVSINAWGNTYCLSSDDKSNSMQIYILGGSASVTIYNTYLCIVEDARNIARVSLLYNPETKMSGTWVYVSKNENRLYLINSHKIYCYMPNLDLANSWALHCDYQKAAFVSVDDKYWIICRSDEKPRFMAIECNSGETIVCVNEYYSVDKIIADRYISLKGTYGSEKYIDTVDSIMCDEAVIACSSGEKIVRYYDLEKKKVVNVLRKPELCTVCLGNIQGRSACAPLLAMCEKCVKRACCCTACKNKE
jgi:hypothetical protein